MSVCVEKIDWEKVREREGNILYGGHMIEDKKENIIRDCHNCGWFKNHVCKAQSPCLAEIIQQVLDAINDLKSNQIEIENKHDRIIRGMQGKADAECKCSGGL